MNVDVLVPDTSGTTRSAESRKLLYDEGVDLILSGAATLRPIQSVPPQALLDICIVALQDLDQLGQGDSSPSTLERISEALAGGVRKPAVGDIMLDWILSGRKLRETITTRFQVRGISVASLQNQLLQCAKTKFPDAPGSVSIDAELGRITRTEPNLLYGPSHCTRTVGAEWAKFCEGVLRLPKLTDETIAAALSTGRILCFEDGLSGHRLLSPKEAGGMTRRNRYAKSLVYLFSEDLGETFAAHSEAPQSDYKRDREVAAAAVLASWIEDAEGAGLRFSKPQAIEGLRKNCKISGRAAEEMVDVHFPKSWQIPGRIPEHQKFSLPKTDS